MVTAWHRRVRERLSAEAERRSARLREFACTLLTAVVGERFAAFSQIGDGAIILEEATLTEPSSGLSTANTSIPRTF